MAAIFQTFTDAFHDYFHSKNAFVDIVITISPNFAPNDSINNIPALVQIMALRLPGD